LFFQCEAAPRFTGQGPALSRQEWLTYSTVNLVGHQHYTHFGCESQAFAENPAWAWMNALSLLTLMTLTELL